MTDRYAVIGNPIAHSRSPEIHAQFAAQTGEPLRYERLLAAPDGFVAAVQAFRAQGGRGLNVTLPFKLQACEFADRLSERARAAGAVNTLVFGEQGVEGENTDGVGMVRDIVERHRTSVDGARVLMAGAGGAARGVLLPLLQAGVGSVLIANRTPDKARQLAVAAADPRVFGCGFDELSDAGPFDLLLNATSSGMVNSAPPLPEHCYAGARLAYDMVYGAKPTRFMEIARGHGCAKVCDGLGMLVEQAAESFWIWRGVMPDTEPVYLNLRRALDGG
ncbi:MAG: shikimate dehydrogenase [Quisquiliibacterium sp.]